VDRNRELVAALITIIFVTVAYLPVVTIERPQASSLIGHGIGIAGFVLMLATETLYSLRKRIRRMARWGCMRTWLSAHIFMGIVGPYLVFLHTGWQFAGLAGVTMLLTGVVVLSGFIGRYIYTAIPRTPSGAILEKAQLERDIRRVEIELHTWSTARPSPLKNLVGQMEVRAASHREGYGNVLTRAFVD
jgi:hypothetical protein